MNNEKFILFAHNTISISIYTIVLSYTILNYCLVNNFIAVSVVTSATSSRVISLISAIF